MTKTELMVLISVFLLWLAAIRFNYVYLKLTRRGKDD